MVLFAVIISSIGSSPTIAADNISLWGRFDTKFKAAQGTADDTRVVAEFTSPSGNKRTIDGFWNGGVEWGLRFMPDEVGRWTYTVSSAPAAEGLKASGDFECRADQSTTNRFRKHGGIRVADARTYLEHADGTPFFWLGDTVWTGPNNATLDDWAVYLKDRKSKHFSVVQFNMPCPWRTAATDRDGMVAFEGRENIKINPKFYERLDSFMDANEQAGFLSCPVLIWSLTKLDPGDYLPEKDIQKIVRYELARYGAHHCVWILAGDNRYDAQQSEKWKRIGRAVFPNGWHQPITTHPTGVNWPWEDWRDEKWLTVFGYQSGHGDDAKTLEWIHTGPVAKSWQNKPARPIINLEPPYEDHNGYHSKRPHPAYHVRRAVYWSLLTAPPAGVTYGGHGLWSWQNEPGKTPPDHAATGVAKTWKEALHLPGSTDMKHMAKLFESLRWWELQPAPELVKDQPGNQDPSRFIAAAQETDRTTIVYYLPKGGVIDGAASAETSGLRARWFNPRTGEGSDPQPANQKLKSPDEQDWLLILE